MPVVFAGYGITAKDDAQKLDYDDYAGLDVKGKAVLILRREPQQDKDGSPFAGKRTVRLRHVPAQGHQRLPARRGRRPAGQRRSPASRASKDELARLRRRPGTDANSTLPFLMLTRAFADKLLTAAGQPSLEDLEKQIDADLKPRSAEP